VGPVFDAHFHVVDPRFPLVANHGYVPAPFTCDDYLAATAGLGITGGAVVSGSFHAFDQTYLLDALARLGPGFVGVTQLPPSVPDAEVRRLDAAGVRAVRFNLRRGGSAGVEHLDELARRLDDLAGWHVEVYADPAELTDLAPVLTKLPRVVIDHLGLTARGLGTVLRLVAQGATVKASGFGRVDLDVPAALRAVAVTDPTALVFGSDLPSTRARRPFSPHDLDVLAEALADESLVRAALYDNALALYRPS
jgi:predicted TIM-barrel fold metal-dependent hydrolase